MIFLLDTHTLLWWLFDEPRLSQVARGIVADPANTILVSSASAWEIATKHRLGRLPSAQVLVQDIAGWVQKAGFRALPITMEHAQRASGWPQPHCDPFDRMLAAHSAIEGAPLITDDAALRAFGLQVVW